MEIEKMGTKKLLDCTLRDGGFINDWEFGHDNIIHIFERLVSSKIDVIEICFLDERRKFDENRTILPNTKSVDSLFGRLDKKDAMIVGMIDYGTCGIENISPCNECFLDGIRVIFKIEKKAEAIAYCKLIKDLGYKVFAQAVSITSYNDEELIELLNLVNELDPYAFSLVDTYGLLHKKLLKHYFDLANERLNSNIGIGYHSHNNFQLAYANCIELLETSVERDLLIDGSLYGMGKSAGNAPIELLATYMNDYWNGYYNRSQMLEAIEVAILDIFKKAPWGYTFKFFISASNDCHPSYVSYLMDKKKLSVKSIDDILSTIDSVKKLTYDKEYIEELYVSYQKKECADAEDIEKLRKLFQKKNVVLLGPGNKIQTEIEKIRKYIQADDSIVIAINFLPSQYKVDYVFLSNAKRYVQLAKKLNEKPVELHTIATSNVTKAKDNFDYNLCYSNLLDEEAMIVDNPMIMLLKLLNGFEVNHVALAGFDGYTQAEQPNYVNPNMEHTFSKEKANEINEDVIVSLARLKMCCELKFITESLYEEGKCVEKI